MSRTPELDWRFDFRKERLMRSYWACLWKSWKPSPKILLCFQKGNAAEEWETCLVSSEYTRSPSVVVAVNSRPVGANWSPDTLTSGRCALDDMSPFREPGSRIFVAPDESSLSSTRSKLVPNSVIFFRLMIWWDEDVYCDIVQAGLILWSKYLSFSFIFLIFSFFQIFSKKNPSCNYRLMGWEILSCICIKQFYKKRLFVGFFSHVYCEIQG